MAGWDEGRVFVSNPISRDEDPANIRGNAARWFSEFFREYREGNTFPYRYIRRNVTIPLMRTDAWVPSPVYLVFLKFEW